MSLRRIHIRRPKKAGHKKVAGKKVAHSHHAMAHHHALVNGWGRKTWYGGRKQPRHGPPTV